MNAIQQIKKSFGKDLDHFCADTEAEYRTALFSLSGEWKQPHELPCDYKWYDTLSLIGLIERSTQQLTRAGANCGFRIYFRIKEL